MRIVAVSTLAISLLLAALASQSAPRATASAFAPAGPASDPTALHRTIDVQALPEQHGSDPF